MTMTTFLLAHIVWGDTLIDWVYRLANIVWST